MLGATLGAAGVVVVVATFAVTAVLTDAGTLATAAAGTTAALDFDGAATDVFVVAASAAGVPPEEALAVADVVCASGCDVAELGDGRVRFDLCDEVAVSESASELPLVACESDPLDADPFDL